MVDSLKNHMENRLARLCEILNDNKDAVKNYERKLVYHKNEISRIQNQIDEIEKLGF